MRSQYTVADRDIGSLPAAYTNDKTIHIRPNTNTFGLTAMNCSSRATNNIVAFKVLAPPNLSVGGPSRNFPVP